MKYPGILQIGGTERNIGKTLLACRILEHFSADFSIAALKISVVDSLPEGSPRKGYRKLNGNYVLTEETGEDTNSNSYRFLESGADRAFWLRTKSAFFSEAFAFAEQTIGKGKLMICESNHFRNFFIPGLFIMLYNDNGNAYKESSRNILSLADLRIHADSELPEFKPGQLKISDDGWRLSLS